MKKDNRIIMRNIFLLAVLLLTGCSGTWSEYNYGPGDWLADKFPGLRDGEGLEIVGPDDYQRLLDPVITVVVVDDLGAACGSHAYGCAAGDAETCTIWVGERATLETMRHEIRHCHGWTHGSKMVAGQWAWYPAREE